MLRTLLVVFISLTTGTAIWAAEVPQTFTYSGRYVHADGSPMPDGVYDLLFALYETPTGGTPVWQELHRQADKNGVNIRRGNFIVVLGNLAGTQAPLPKFDRSYYVSVFNPQTQQEVMGRTALSSTPYAIMADRVNRRVSVATGLGPEDTENNGPVNKRELDFNKQYDDTAIRVFYCDNFQISGDNAYARWEIRLDDKEPSGDGVFQDKYSSSGNYHNPGAILGYFQSLKAGKYKISVWVVPVPGGTLSNVTTGWSNSRWTIEAEEVWLQP